jgi:N-acetylglutamate synthase-like GNAT family acetyltransferase
MTFKIIKQDTEEYRQMIDLRITALLSPIGVPAHYIIPEKEKNDIFIVALEQSEIIGCCILTPIDNEQVQLRQMAVRADYQGKGIGAQIIKFGEQTARQNGFSELSMNARNPVIAFYEKSGYAITGSEFFEVGIAHHKMKKKLS